MTTNGTRPTTTVPRPRRPTRAAGLGLLAATMLAAGALLPAGGALAQVQPERLLELILPGAGQQQAPEQLLADAERACARYAREQGLEAGRVRDARRAGVDNLELTLSVEGRDERYDALCVYDTGDGEVRGIERVRGTETRRRDDERGRGGDEVGEQLAQRAREACWDLARRRDLGEVDFHEVRARSRDTVEVTMEARARSGRRDLTCLYDDDRREAFLGE
ncbi:MAG TPA: hypothetical protein VFG47_19735 [Geminicoccaceae bacterium]|nr:hypothetical protein [Geminicoccaceae bacterium]